MYRRLQNETITEIISDKTEKMDPGTHSNTGNSKNETISESKLMLSDSEI